MINEAVAPIKVAVEIWTKWTSPEVVTAVVSKRLRSTKRLESTKRLGFPEHLAFEDSKWLPSPSVGAMAPTLRGRYFGAKGRVAPVPRIQSIYRGTSPMRKRPPPQDPPRTLGVSLR